MCEQKNKLYTTKQQKQLLRDFIQRAYGGSVKALVMHALATRKSSSKDLETIEKLLDRFEGGAAPSTKPGAGK